MSGMLGSFACRLLGDAPVQDDAMPSLRRFGVAGLAAGAAVVVGAVVGGSSFVSHLPGAWFFGTPGGPLGSMSASADRAPALALLGVYGGLGALVAIWWRLLKALRAHPGVPVRQIARVVAAWAAPFVVAPPLFSRDVYSYAGQGALVSFHINPYHYGPGVLGATPFNLLAGPLWANTPSPYGPTFLSLDGLVTQLSGHQVLADLVLLRLLSVIGLALIVVGLPVLARSVGRDPAFAVALGACSPLVLATIVGGAHNDGLMVGLLVAGLAAWKRWGPVPGIVLCALAAGVKAPAALGIVLIGWNWAGPYATVVRRCARTLLATGIAAAVLAALSAASGLGWGWVLTLTSGDKISTGVTPVEAVTRAVAGVVHLVGVSMPAGSVRAVVATVAVAVAVAVGAWLLWRSPRLGPLRALALSLLVLALLSPVLWAWYLTWGLVLLAPVATGWLRRAVVWLSIGETVIGASSVLGVLRSLRHAGIGADVLVVVGVAGAILLALRANYELRTAPWSGQRATQAPGVTVTAIQRPHSGQ
jgi:alpha-1,6-mannosyltransferase